ncbi:hypothetical protein ACFFLM_14730 [Deinococcus oregonensis]|uniref:Uncharacterized protein n=1 Tax=Deinococcus oregonensis TaxID=1805970 RepID=A0ABV6B0F4_9DEIO
MLTLQGKYHVAQNKRLTILAEATANQPLPLAVDIDALRDACADTGRCDLYVMTQHGLMQGTLVEKRPMKFNLGSYEGHLSFLPADKKAEHVAATAARTPQHQG